MADDPKLATALRQAKQAPMFFAFVAKGSTEGVLMVAKKKIPVKEINEAKAETGGKKVFSGRCVGEDGKMVFEMPVEPPGTLAKQLKAVISDSAGMMLQVETRIAPDLQEEEGDENESTDTGAIPQAPPLPGAQQPGPVPPLPPPGQQQDPGAARFGTRLKALAPIMQRLEGNTSPGVKDAKLALSAANALFRAKEFTGANQKLDEVEGLIKKALSPPQGGSDQEAPTQNQADPAATRFAARLKALAPVAQKADATGSDFARQAKVQIGEANKLYLARQYNDANAALDRAESLIKQAFAGIGQPRQGFEQALATYQSVREQTVRRLRVLAKEVASEDHPDAVKGEIEIKSVITNLTQAPTVRAQVVLLEHYLAQDDVVADVCDLEYDFRTPLLKSLGELKTLLPA